MSKGNRLALTNTATSSLTVEGPYDAFQVEKRSNPALFVKTLAPKANIEIKYTGTSSPSASVRTLGKYDMAMYDAGGELTSYSRQVNNGSATIGTGNRLALMNSDTKSMEVYGPYDVFEVSDREIPVTFQQTLLPGESSEYLNKMPNPFYIYPAGQYDYAEYSVVGSSSVLSETQK